MSADESSPARAIGFKSFPLAVRVSSYGYRTVFLVSCDFSYFIVSLYVSDFPNVKRAPRACCAVLLLLRCWREGARARGREDRILPVNPGLEPRDIIQAKRGMRA